MSFLVNPYSYAGCDADALAFLAAAGITDATITSAICTLVSTMKSDGTWAKMSAIYPMVGGTATTHKFNLKNPADTNAAFRLSFVGGITHSANGVAFNGTNSYANTFLAPSTGLTLNSHSFGIYSRTNSINGNRIYGANNGVQVLQQNIVLPSLTQGAFGSGNSSFAYSINTTSFFVATRTSNVDFKAFRAGVLLGSSAISMTSLPNFNFYFGARNDSGTAAFFSNHQIAFAFLGSGLTDGEAAALYTSVQAFQTTLSRQV